MNIWTAVLDGAWDCKVERINEREGRLTVATSNPPEIILDETVPLAYGAVFGPDVADVAAWEEKCTAAVDKVILAKRRAVFPRRPA